MRTVAFFVVEPKHLILAW